MRSVHRIGGPRNALTVLQIQVSYSTLLSVLVMRWSRRKMARARNADVHPTGDVL